jgi:hypothetical protein
LKFQDTEKAKAIMDEIRSYNDLYN